MQYKNDLKIIVIVNKALITLALTYSLITNQSNHEDHSTNILSSCSVFPTDGHVTTLLFFLGPVTKAILYLFNFLVFLFLDYRHVRLFWVFFNVSHYFPCQILLTYSKVLLIISSVSAYRCGKCCLGCRGLFLLEFGYWEKIGSYDCFHVNDMLLCYGDCVLSAPIYCIVYQADPDSNLVLCHLWDQSLLLQLP